VLPHVLLERKIRIKLPDVLPRAIHANDIELLLGAISTGRDKAMILLLLRTGMRIGELLKVELADISQRERKYWYIWVRRISRGVPFITVKMRPWP
jgi:integrase